MLRDPTKILGKLSTALLFRRHINLLGLLVYFPRYRSQDDTLFEK